MARVEKRVSFSAPLVTQTLEFSRYDHGSPMMREPRTRQSMKFTKGVLDANMSSVCICSQNVASNVQCTLCGLHFMTKKRKPDEYCDACLRGEPLKQVSCFKCSAMVHEMCYHGQNPECVECKTQTDISSHRLHMDGFAVYRNAFELDSDTRDAIYESRYLPIFNGLKDDQLTYDGKRLQAEGEWRSAYRKALHRFVQSQGLMQCKNGTKEIKDVYALKSLPGCPMQPKHADSSLEKGMRLMEPSDVPLAAIYALEPDTRLMVWRFDSGKSSAIVMQPNDLVVFRGDLAHAGFEYEVENTRLHAYIDSSAHGCKRLRGKTYILVGGDEHMCE